MYNFQGLNGWIIIDLFLQSPLKLWPLFILWVHIWIGEYKIPECTHSIVEVNQDSSLYRFINLCDYLESKKIPPRIGESNIEREMKKALLEIEKSELEPLVKNLPVILDKLIELLITMYKIGGQTLGLGATVFETLCVASNKLAVSQLLQFNRSSMLNSSLFSDLARRFGFGSMWSTGTPKHLYSIPM